MYDIKIRNSVLNLFLPVEVNKFPDESFVYKEEKEGIQIFQRKFSLQEMVCNLFDLVEKQINAKNNKIERVIFKASSIQNIETEFLSNLVNNLFNYLGKDELKKQEFNFVDEKDFCSNTWEGRTWLSTLTNGVSLIIYKKNGIVELRLTFIS